MEDKEIKKIKIHHAVLVIIFIIVLLTPVVIIKINIEHKKAIENSEAKEEAITFLKANINELEPICKEIIVNRNSECTKWGYYYLCYSDNAVLTNETGLTRANWDLKYSNDNWYVIVNSNNSTFDITKEVK